MPHQWLAEELFWRTGHRVRSSKVLALPALPVTQGHSYYIQKSTLVPSVGCVLLRSNFVVLLAYYLPDDDS